MVLCPVAPVMPPPVLYKQGVFARPSSTAAAPLPVGSLVPVICDHDNIQACAGFSWPVAPSPPAVIPAPGASRVGISEARGFGDTELPFERDEFDPDRASIRRWISARRAAISAR